MLPQPSECVHCGQRHLPSSACDVDARFLWEERLRRKAELDVEIAKAEEDLRPERVALTLARWQQNATCSPMPEDPPDREHADVSLPAMRAWADWQRQHEEGS